MTRRLLALSGALGALLAATQPAVAAPKTHDGFYLRLEPNFGPVTVTESFGNVESELSGFGSGAHVQLGGTPVRGLVIGGTLFGTSVPDPEIKVGSLTGTADGNMLLAGVGVFGNYYFDPAGGGHVQLVLGLAALDYVDENGSSGGSDPTGTVVGLGGGYEFWVSDEWSIGPFGRIDFGSLSAESGGATIDYSYFQPTLGATFTLH